MAVSPDDDRSRLFPTDGGGTRRGSSPLMVNLYGNLLLGLVATIAISVTLVALLSVFWVTRRRRGLPDWTPPVTILKPLKGLDEDLEGNLRSFFRLDYPVYQLLFCVADPDDPAIPLVQRLLREFPDQDARLIVGCPRFGLNPKVESLAAMERARRHDTILISDSNVRARPSYLQETACYLADPGVGLVTNLFAGTGEEQAGAALENLQLNGIVAGGVATASLLGITCVVGKSMLMPARVLEAIGGFASVRNLLAEDQAIGIRVRKAGYSIRLSHHVVENPNHTRSFRWFLNRHSRWFKIRRRLAPATFVIEPSFNLATVGVVWALAGDGSGLAWTGLFGFVGLGMARDAIQAKRLRGTFPSPRHLLLSPLKDLFLLPVWFDALLNRRIQWRGNRFLVGKYTRLRSARTSRDVRLRVRRVMKVRAQHQHGG
ncbi:ceramide glucosyltransferase [Tundrisphaera sp. TA3]|uniref:ceramide glucosyltransferase n=1 Tax=Tundrisphaera sp. TA3 TaxID=3435775 RepID=UPI003EB7B3E6